jgi:serine-type D-Ala-D-Ala carboxypeptidase (penicillin-binding protein 5/6)
MFETIHGAVKFVGHTATVRWLLLSWAIAVCVSPAHATGITITGQAAVLMEMRTGKVLWQRNKDLSLAPASTTKILTALVVIERSKTSDVVTVPIEATVATGGTAHLRAGERVSVEQLLYGMLLGSANDAAIALANHSSGSVARFVNLMNKEARSLGALRSSFRNPTGLPQKGHVATAHDLAAIARSALANPALRKIFAARSYPWRSAQWQGEIKNSNVLLETYQGAIGVKTGQTREAGFCLVAAAARGSEGFIAVVLKSTEQSGWQDTRNVLDYGFKNFSANKSSKMFQ